MTRNKQISFTVRNSKAKEFIAEVNKNIVTDEFLSECKKASKVFRKRKFTEY